MYKLSDIFPKQYNVNSALFWGVKKLSCLELWRYEAISDSVLFVKMPQIAR